MMSFLRISKNSCCDPSEEHEAKEIGSNIHEKYLKLVEELERHCP